MPSPPSQEAVLDALRPVEDPELHRSIVDLDMVRAVTITGDRVAVTVAPFTMPSSTTERPRRGSSTVRSAASSGWSIGIAGGPRGFPLRT